MDASIYLKDLEAALIKAVLDASTTTQPNGNKTTIVNADMVAATCINTLALFLASSKRTSSPEGTELLAKNLSESIITMINLHKKVLSESPPLWSVV